MYIGCSVTGRITLVGDCEFLGLTKAPDDFLFFFPPVKLPRAINLLYHATTARPLREQLAVIAMLA